MRTLTITYTKSNEGAPVLCVSDNNLFSTSVIRVFTGEEAESLYKKLTSQNVVVEIKGD